MTRLWGTAATVAVALMVSSCTGGADTPAVEPDATPSLAEQVTVTVAFEDLLPLEVLHNGGGGRCISVDIVARLLGEARGRVKVSLRDAGGELVGTRTLPRKGGTFLRSDGCLLWTADFTVDASDFYEVTVDSRAGTETATVEPDGNEAEVLFSF